MIDILLAYIINCDLNLGLIKPAGIPGLFSSVTEDKVVNQGENKKRGRLIISPADKYYQSAVIHKLNRSMIRDL